LLAEHRPVKRGITLPEQKSSSDGTTGCPGIKDSTALN
jgi:hypothetical protein